MHAVHTGMDLAQHLHNSQSQGRTLCTVVGLPARKGRGPEPSKGHCYARPQCHSPLGWGNCVLDHVRLDTYACLHLPINRQPQTIGVADYRVCGKPVIHPSTPPPPASSVNYFRSSTPTLPCRSPVGWGDFVLDHFRFHADACLHLPVT
jgi:hypothetical protein